MTGRAAPADRPCRGAGAPLSARAGFAFLTAGLFIAVTAGRLLSTEVFVDGVTYGVVARNLATGRGSFWSPSYVEGLSPFHQHPPLGLWLESLAFRLLGDGPFVEQVWGIACFAIVAALVARLWRRSDGERELAWWPVLLLLLMPLSSWVATAGLLEGPLTVCTLVALLLCLAALRQPRWRGVLALGLAAGMATAGGLLVKGPPALYVLVAPAAALVLHGAAAMRRALALMAALALGLAATTALTAALGGAGAERFLVDYLRDQLRPSLLGQHEHTSRGLLLLAALRELSIPGLLVLLGFLGIAPGQVSSLNRRRAALFGLCALAAILPFVPFGKQLEWYLAPALPLCALALGALGEPVGRALLRDLGHRGSVLLVSLGVLLSTLGLIGGSRRLGHLDTSLPVALRDALDADAAAARGSEHAWRDFRRDVLTSPLASSLRGARISGVVGGDYFRTLAYLARHLDASLIPAAGAPYALRERGEDPVPPPGCRPVDAPPARRFLLYFCPSP